ncbi:hypothetical protein LPN04_04100 [Rugamonas sp. A1-17]|nr:hypothetical protein [Rugamonas sp. A1-17]
MVSDSRLIFGRQSSTAAKIAKSGSSKKAHCRGQIVDASLVQAPVQRNKREDADTVKEGAMPLTWGVSEGRRAGIVLSGQRHAKPPADRQFTPFPSHHRLDRNDHRNSSCPSCVPPHIVKNWLFEVALLGASYHIEIVGSYQNVTMEK